MKTDEWDVLEPARSKQRTLAARFEQELTALTASVGSDKTSALARAWADLVVALALGEEPRLRGCPHCRRNILHEATRCRYCMRGSLAERAAA
jgi:hypothetical protein